MANARRRSFKQIVEYLSVDIDNSSSSESSSDEDDIDFLLLETAFAPEKKLGFRISLNDVSEDDCEKLFRFEKGDMRRLQNALKIPDDIVCVQGTVATGMEVLLIRRLAYPNRWSDLVPLFGRSKSELGLIFNKVVDNIYESHKELLTSLNSVWLDTKVSSQAVHAKGAPLDQFWGFIVAPQDPLHDLITTKE